jgi:LuxR family maltose regulon positive regulatory protein
LNGENITITKFNIPKQAGIILSRSRLLEKMDHGVNGKLTLICAPAGSGKTTLAGQWAASSVNPVAWFSLDEFDDDFVRFWKGMLSIFESYEMGCFDHIRSMLSSSPPANFHTVIAHLINELNERNKRLVIVLDDFHFISNELIHASFVYLIRRLPAHLHFLIISRTEPPFPLMRWASANELLRIDAAELNFTMTECRQYMELMNIHLSYSQMQQLQKQTEGWVTGVRLAALTLQDTHNYDQFIDSVTGSHRSFSDYLFHEVIQSQPADVQDFLLRTSILKRFSAPLCEVISGRPNGQLMLSRLEQANLFLIPLDERRDWFRYHHLFADFLEQRLRTEDPGLWQELYFQAGKWFEDHQNTHEAIEYYLAGGLERQAVQLIERIFPELISGRWSILCRWLSALPAPLLEEKPDLFYMHVFCFALDGDWKAVQEKWHKAERYYHSRKGSWQESDRNKYKGFLHLIRSFLAVCQLGDLEEAIIHSDLYFRHIPDTATMHYIDVETGDISILRAFGGIMGKLKKAEPFFSKMIDIWGHAEASMTAIFYIGYAEALFEWNRLEEAESNAWIGYELGKKLGSAQVTTPAAVLLSKIYVLKYSADRAVRFLKKVKAHFLKHHYHQWADYADAQILRLGLHEMDAADLSDWLEARSWMLDEDLPPNMLPHVLVIVRVLIRLEQWEEAEYWLDHVYKLSERSGRLGEKIEGLVLKALLFKRKKQMGQAVKVMTEAFALGENDQYIRTFLDEKQEAFDLLKLCIQNYTNELDQHDQHPGKPTMLYLNRLYDEFKDELLRTNQHFVHPSLTEPLTGKEKEVLLLLSEGLPNRQIADRLQITIGTVKTHLHRIYEKIQVKNRWEAIDYVRRKWHES